MIIKKEDEKVVQKDYKKYKDTYHHITDFKRIYTDNNISIYIFDANGDSPWELECDTVIPIAIETYYLDGEKPWTRINGNDCSFSLKQWLKGKVSANIYKDICKNIEYSK